MFGKIKQALGVKTVKIALETPPSAEIAGTTLSGNIELTAESDQLIEDMAVRLIEKFSTGRGTEKKTREFELGHIKLPNTFEMKGGDVKKIPFSLTFKVRKSGNDQLKEYGGALGAIGKLGAIMEAESSQYVVRAVVSLRGAVVSPQDQKNIDLV